MAYRSKAHTWSNVFSNLFNDLGDELQVEPAWGCSSKNALSYYDLKIELVAPKIDLQDIY